MSANSFILPFDSLDATPGAVGGKGANLSLMTRAYFPAPPGFLIWDGRVLVLPMLIARRRSGRGNSLAFGENKGAKFNA